MITPTMRTVRHPIADLATKESDALFIPRLPFVATVDDVLTADECASLVDRIESLSPSFAPITVGEGRFVERPDIRNNDRVMFDDTALAALLFERLRDAIPTVFDGNVACGMNERFRCYRYTRGQRFAPHFDGAYRRNESECSELTLLVYLSEGCEGGETAFNDFDVVVTPRRGMALLFQHAILHEGCVVRGGSKYVARSDVMYRDPSAQE